MLVDETMVSYLKGSCENIKDLLEEMDRKTSEYDVINYDKNKKLIDFKECISNSLEDINYILEITKRLGVERNGNNARSPKQNAG